MDPRISPTGVKAPHGGRLFVVTWGDEEVSSFPHELLRGYCPCAGCQGHGGSIVYQPGHDLDLRQVEQVGNYALQLTWGDGHDSGIYSFRFLRLLGDLIAAHGQKLPEVHPELPH